jgi:hypothetical protein
MSAKNRSSVLISIFKRKGGEGQYTKMLNDTNRSNYLGPMSNLTEDESGLVICHEDDLNWFMTSNKRIFNMRNGELSIVSHPEVADVSLALEEEFKEKIKSKNHFTRLLMITTNGEKHILKIEMGLPYAGVYQMLHFIARTHE